MSRATTRGCGMSAKAFGSRRHPVARFDPRPATEGDLRSARLCHRAGRSALRAWTALARFQLGSCPIQMARTRVDRLLAASADCRAQLLPIHTHFPAYSHPRDWSAELQLCAILSDLSAARPHFP